MISFLANQARQESNTIFLGNLFFQSCGSSHFCGWRQLAWSKDEDSDEYDLSDIWIDKSVEQQAVA
jgi:hypothetical protein